MTKLNTRRFGQTNYPVGDFLIQVKNAALAENREIVVKNSKLIESVAKSLKELGYLESVKAKEGQLTVVLTYKNREPVLMDLKLISKPGLRIYWGIDELEAKKKPVYYILSTNKGILTSKKAKKERLGGEVIAEIL